MTKRPVRAGNGKLTDNKLQNNPKELAIEMMRFVCRAKLEHYEQIEMWHSYEARLIEGYRTMTDDDLKHLCNDIACGILDYLLQSDEDMERQINEYIDCSDGEDQPYSFAP